LSLLEDGEFVGASSGDCLIGKVAAITGAGRGIGAAIALGFADAGADIVVADVDNQRAEETAHKLATLGRRTLAVKTDVGVSAEVSRMFQVVQAEFGQLDILVNNAGIWFRKPFLDISDEEWDLVLTTNLKGTFLCTQHAARLMTPRKAGCIINIASHAGIFYSRGQGAHYAASKAGIIQLTRVLAFELGPFQIRINAIAPGGINTGISATTKPQPIPSQPIGARDSPSNPLGRRGEPEDIAQAAVYLASPLASFITGQTLVVNGGALGSL
jgi:NAD(P)-dependent dehydrogenase (short-subunit alcohol dehydrogenase family)